MIRFRPEEGAGGEAPEATPEAAPAPEATPAPSFDPSAFASKEDLAGLQKNLDYLVSMFQEPEEVPEAGEEGEFDVAAYLDQAVDARLQPVRPLLDATVKERGEREMQNIFTRMKSEVGDFDPKLAERVAQSFLSEHGGDPVKATEEGARFAAEVRKSERAAGKSEHVERLRRGPLDPEPSGEGGQAVKTRAKDKTYDDVIERWSGESEA